MTPLLEVEDLAVSYPGGVEALRGISFTLDHGESLGVVGESGSGKTTLALCLSGLVQTPEASGSVRLAGSELLGATPDELRRLRWATVAIGLQGAPFNPVARVGDQVAEPLRERLGMGRKDARRRASELAAEVALDPALLERFPHELSGGERRRATLAMVMALDPALVVLDEPTAGLDPATRQEVVERIQALATQRGFALVVISHDLPDATHLARRTVVLYAGAAVEAGPSERVIGDPAHPYAWALVNAYPVMSTTKDLRPIRGRSPDPRETPAGCAFHPRCSQAEEVCVAERPLLAPSRGRLVACHFGGLKTLLEAKGVTKTYSSGEREVAALVDVSIMVREGEALGVVGPSGSGKSTLARILSGDLAPDAGEVHLCEEVLSTSWRRDRRALRRRVQLVMQDPWDACSPRLTVEELVREPLDIGATLDVEKRRRMACGALDSVGLPSSGAFLAARAHELSGGQLQRVALARALVAAPKILVADEPTSMLDASEQARLLLVVRERQLEMGVGLILVSHDLALVRKVTDRIVVLDHGEVVEEGPSNVVCSAPASKTTRRLIDSSPVFAPATGDPRAERDAVLRDLTVT